MKNISVEKWQNILTGDSEENTKWPMYKLDANHRIHIKTKSEIPFHTQKLSL